MDDMRYIDGKIYIDCEVEWENLVGIVPFPVFVKNSEAQFIYFNKLFLSEINTFEKQTWLGSRVDDIDLQLSDEQKVFIRDCDEKILREGCEVSNDIELICNDGKTHYFQEIKFLAKSDCENKKYIVGILVDITEKIELQKELSKEQNFLASLLGNSTDNIYFKDINSKFLKVSNAFAQRHGLKIAELIGKTDADLYGKIHSREALQDEQEIIRTGRSIIGKEEKEDWANGKTTWVSTSKMPFYDNSGKVIGTFGVSRDITSLKKNEEEKSKLIKFEKIISKIATILLKHSSDNFVAALPLVLREIKEVVKFEKSSIYFIDERENVLKKMYEYSENSDLPYSTVDITEFINWYKVLNELNIVFDTEMDVLKYGHSEELNYFIQRKCLQIIILPLVNYKILSGFVIFECADHSNIWLKSNKSLFMILGEVLSNSFVNFQSEKYRLEAEEEMLKFLWAANQSTNMIIILDKYGYYEYVNGKYTEVSGYDFVDVVGKAAEYLKPDSNLFDSNLIRSQIDAGLHWEGKIQNVTKSGKTYWEWISISPIKNMKGEITNLLVIAEDVTERMVEDSRKAISQKLESIGQLAAGIAHEINTPMQYIGDNTLFLSDTIKSLSAFMFKLESEIKTAMTGGGQTLLGKYDQLKKDYDIDYLLEEISNSIDQTRTGINRVTNIVKAMKDFAHPGKKEKIFSDINHGIEVTSTISKNEWKYLADMELQLSKDLPPVYCLQDELNQVILIMIINAAHAIEEKNGKNSFVKGLIKIQTYLENDNVVIKITDTGNGIKEENISKVFDPFYTTKEVGKGTGQGLTIAHDLIINKHNGAIFVDSVYTEGTTFTLKVPIDKKNE
ncbi:MAG: PAS domain S-box protein [Melioribacteraceae bacterium]